MKLIIEKAETNRFRTSCEDMLEIKECVKVKGKIGLEDLVQTRFLRDAGTVWG